MTKGDHTGTQRMNSKITEYVQSKKGRNEINTILTAYITFNTEEGGDEAHKYIKDPTKFVKQKSMYNNFVQLLMGNNHICVDESHNYLLGENMVFDLSGMPSNIIWENKCINGFEKVKRIILCFTVVVIMTSLAFWFIVKIKISSNEVSNRYVLTNCGELYRSYTEADILEQAAFRYREQQDH